MLGLLPSALRVAFARLLNLLSVVIQKTLELSFSLLSQATLHNHIHGSNSNFFKKYCKKFLKNSNKNK